MRRRLTSPGLAFRVGVLAVVASFAIAWLVMRALVADGYPELSAKVFAAVAAGPALLSGLSAAFYVHFVVIRRMRRMTEHVEAHLAKGDDLRRLPPLGHDEVGDLAEHVNALFARVTELRVSIIDHERELARAREELRLREELAQKTQELGRRLQERDVLFEIVRISASEAPLDEVLGALVRELGPVLGIRELALLLADDDGSMRVRAVHGFPRPEAVIGRRLALGEGICGRAAELGAPVLVDDVSGEANYLAFWGEAPREGACAAFPIVHGQQRVGLIALTRPVGGMLDALEIRLMHAVADQLALAIRHAQVFAELRELSTHDALTGLANRRLLFERLERERDRLARNGPPASLVTVDLDHFKQLNDACGHAAGDQALVRLAGLFKANIRRVDTAARTGGEEFLILLPQTALDQAAIFAEKLRALIEAERFEGEDKVVGGQLTASFGVTDLYAGESVDHALGRADRALYRAKEAGRNRVQAIASSDEVAGRASDQTSGIVAKMPSATPKSSS